MEAKSLSVPAVKPALVQIPLADIAASLDRRKAGLLVSDVRIPRSPLKRRPKESDVEYASREASRIEKLRIAGAKDAEALEKLGFGAIGAEVIESKVDFLHLQTVKVGKIAIKANSRAGMALRALSAPIVEV